VIVEITASVAAGTTYTLVCVLADGLIAPSRLYDCAIFDYIPDNIKIFGSGGKTAFGSSFSIVTAASAIFDVVTEFA